MRELLANAGEDDEREAEADGGSKREEDGLEESGSLLAVDFRRAENGAVRRDEGKEDAKRSVKRRQETLHRDVDELDERRDDENERKRVDVAEAVRLKKPVVKAPRHRRGDRHDEHDCARHAERRVELLRHPEERAATEKAAQNEVVHKNRTNKKHQVVAHRFVPIIPLFTPGFKRPPTLERRRGSRGRSFPRRRVSPDRSALCPRTPPRS